MKEPKFKEYGPVIQVCPDCGKVDVSKGHEEECDPEYQTSKEEYLDYLYKDWTD